MSERRQQRIAEEIRKRVSQFVREELKDPRLGFLTFTAVDVNGDLTHAVVHVSVLGDEVAKKDTMEALRRAKGLIRRDVDDWLRIRSNPDISFKLDTSLERGDRILQLMETLHHEESE